MMFTITIKNIGKKQLGELIAHIGTRKHSIDVTYHDDEPEAKPNGAKKVYAKDTDILVLTGKNAKKGSIRGSILETLEKMEAKSGIGSVTRKALREQCEKKGVDHQIIYQLIRDGYMKVNK